MRRQILLPYLQDLDHLLSIFAKSPYIAREERLTLEKEIHYLREQLNAGEISLPEGERAISYLHKRGVCCEIESVTKKIRLLNPASPRLAALNLIAQGLQDDLFSAKEARHKLLELMSVQ